MNSNTMLAFVIIVAVILVMFLISQRKFKNKMLCEFIRPSKQKIEAWVPMHVKYVTFDQGKYGVQQYIINPRALMHQWYARGINKFFPVLIPTLLFRWDTPFPIDPETFEPTVLSPEALEAAWQEHNHIAFAKANAAATGLKKNMIEKFAPLVIIGLLVIVGYLVWSGNNHMSQALFDLQQQLKLMK